VVVQWGIVNLRLNLVSQRAEQREKKKARF
jgi:hypothetical protein